MDGNDLIEIEDDKNQNSTLAEDSNKNMATAASVLNWYNGNWYRLVFNETMLLLSRDQEIYIRLGSDLNNWNLRVIFDSASSPSIFNVAPAQVKTEVKEGEIEIRLTNWYSETGTQNTEPLILESIDKKLTALTVIRSVANKHQDQRAIAISIWRKIIG